MSKVRTASSNIEEVHMMPERFSNEWFEMIEDWEGENDDMVTEYNLLQEYRETQAKLDEWSDEVRHRIYSGG
jgi:hypothetical protein